MTKIDEGRARLAVCIDVPGSKDSSIVVWKVRESKAFVPEATALMPFEARRPLDEGEDEGGGEERPEISSLRGEDPTTGVLFCKDSAPDEEDDEEEERFLFCQDPQD
eukprot:TRINITY_DN4512_c0_g2_i1.p2 TRINITY_DN4512_c0_g2~~TRINITY_DN4512_c0_g2_i1.p2  ORF type:complete len:107 (-),score=29.21 TRINITY_DN4512_c0_g2_i1:10-330(-)